MEDFFIKFNWRCKITTIYFVRHALSAYSLDEYSWPLSVHGELDAVQLVELFHNIHIDQIISSPYKRAIQTIEPLENLKERVLAGIPVVDFEASMESLWRDEYFSFEGGESNVVAQKRAVEAIEPYLNGQVLFIGTHGNIMTLLLNAFDSSNGIDYWRKLKMPDVVKCVLKNNNIDELTSLIHY